VIRKALFNLYWMLQRRIAPGVVSSQNHYARIVKMHVTSTTRWLELGCGRQLWPEFIAGQAETARRAALLVGLDPDADSLKHNAVVHHRVVGMQLPFRDASFNLVTANMVFEHLHDPVAVLSDIRRVLTPGGVCIFHTPNARHWLTILGRNFPQPVKNLLVRFSEGRDAKDVYPTHYRINTEESVIRVLADAGFSSDQVVMVNTSAAGRILLLGPLVVLELLWVRLTERPGMRRHRTNIIAVGRPVAR
jgi:ubiquinone/menaquinone biosynthesis C-methylase UbiE